jgi:hydrogenase maturation protease
MAPESPVARQRPVTGVVVVLGLGNPLLEDDGAGLALLELLRARGPWPDAVELVDGGTWGLSLLPVICDAERLLVLDAVRTGAPPGTVLRGEGEAVPRLYERPLSPHQIDLREVLAAAVLLDGLPADLTVIGIEPERTEGLRVGLTPAVSAALDLAVREAVRVLEAWGIGSPDGEGTAAARGDMGHARAVDQPSDRRGGARACR